MEKKIEQSPQERNIEGTRAISMEEWINLEDAAAKRIQEQFNDGKAEIEKQKTPSGGQTITVRDAETGNIIYFSCEAGDKNIGRGSVDMEELALMEIKAEKKLYELAEQGKVTQKIERNPKTGEIDAIIYRDEQGKILLMYNYKELDKLE